MTLRDIDATVHIKPEGPISEKGYGVQGLATMLLFQAVPTAPL